MSTSILDQEYNEPYRPYSQRELQYDRNRVFSTLRIGTTRAHHTKCNHFYLVKKHGQKEKEIKASNKKDSGNCSVCWKLNKTPNRLRKKARNLVKEYCKRFYTLPKYLSYDDVDLETTFYKWLYEEVNQEDNNGRVRRNGGDRQERYKE